MTVKEYNKEFLPRINRAKEFITLFESAIRHMDEEMIDKDEILRQFQIYCWNEETKKLIMEALSYFQKHEGLERIERPYLAGKDEPLIPCPFCGGKLRRNLHDMYEHGQTGCILSGFEFEEKWIPLWNKRTLLDDTISQLHGFADASSDSICTSATPQYYDGLEDGIRKAIEILEQKRN